MIRSIGWRLLPVACLAALTLSAARAQEAGDWPMYNHDVLGHRHNFAEKAIGPRTASNLEEKWRFPPAGSDLQIGVVHATPVVVNGYVYFGTATDPTFSKLTPDGQVRWSYRNPELKSVQSAAAANPNLRFGSSAEGILGSALVTTDTVYFGDLAGWFYALDRATGTERWKRSARAPDFPGKHPLNSFFASPILAGGKLIIAGGALEQTIAGTFIYPGSTGRGFVTPRTAKSSGNTTWVPSRSDSNRRSRLPIVGAGTRSAMARQRAPCGARRRSTPRRPPSSSART